MLKLLGRVLFLGLVAAVVYALWKQLTGADEASVTPTPFTPSAVPAPAASVMGTPAERAPAPPSDPGPAAPSSPAWIGSDDGACPVSHPVKAKLSSGIFHVPGGQNYDRTRADRCYTDGDAAEADGLRRAKR
ncbi:MAG: sunset domain-containing protein [Acidimicrobiia bacterium]